MDRRKQNTTMKANKIIARIRNSSEDHCDNNLNFGMEENSCCSQEMQLNAAARTIYSKVSNP